MVKAHSQNPGLPRRGLGLDVQDAANVECRQNEGLMVQRNWAGERRVEMRLDRFLSIVGFVGAANAIDLAVQQVVLVLWW